MSTSPSPALTKAANLAILRKFLRSVGCILALIFPAKAAPGGNDWMESIGGTVRLSQISIPGTHDSGARVEGPLAGTAKCQNATIAEQLSYGVRFLDIRCKHENNVFTIYHGSVNQNLTFTQVLDQVTGFLNANPGECVMMSIKEETASSGTTRSFEATFDTYVALDPTKWSLATNTPALSGVRGKIQLVRRFGATVVKGIDATNWPDNTTFNVNNLRVQDQYQVPDNAEKWTSITDALSAAFAETNANILHLNFTSGYKPGLFGIPNITTVSNAINPQLDTYFGTAARGRYGCLLMDFADATRPALIYQTNFIAPVFTTTPLTRAAVLKSTSYAATLADSATDANPGETLSYRKIAGPAWLNIAANGALSGTPGNSDLGPNIFTIRVTDDTGLFAEAPLNISVADTTAFWDRDGSTSGAGGTAPAGTWDVTSTWNVAATGAGTTIGWLPGQSAVFAAGSNATGTYTVTVGGTQDISGLSFQEGLVTLTGGTALRLVANSAVDVSSGLTATVSASVSQDATPRSFTKTGTGILALSGANTHSGGTTINQGKLIVQTTNTALGNSASVVNVDALATLQINQNNGSPNTTFAVGNAITGAGTLEFTASAAPATNARRLITVGSLGGFTGTISILANGNYLADTTDDTIHQNLTIATGGFLTISSNVNAGFGTLNGNGTIMRNIGTTANASLTLGNNDATGGVFSGSIQGASTAANSGLFNSSGVIAVTKVGSGTQTLSGTNTFGGATTLSGGTLALGANDVLPNTTAVSIGSGTLDAATFTDTVGTLNVTGSAVINLGPAAALAFSSGSPTWTGMLTLTGTFVSGASLRFGTTITLRFPHDPDQTKFVRLRVTTNG